MTTAFSDQAPHLLAAAMGADSDVALDEELDDCGSDAGDVDRDLDGATTATAPSGAGSTADKKRRKPASTIADQHGSKRRKAANGKKWCPAHGRYEPLESFPTGSGQCGDGRKILQNLRNAAIAQGQQEWFENMIRDPALLKKTVAAYEVVFGVPQSVSGRCRICM